MIELPEAITFSKQIDKALKSKTIKSLIRGQNRYKLMFPMNPDQLGGVYSNEEFAHILRGKTMTRTLSDGNIILIAIHPGFILNFGCGGEVILYHPQQKAIPKKHQLLVGFEDKTYLTVIIPGWGGNSII